MKCPTFLVDVKVAEAACASMDRPDVDITPFGLGMAFQAQASGRGLLVPGDADVEAAGTAFAEDAFPMFTCAELVSDRADGTPTVPVFVCASDAAAAAAGKAAGGGDLEITCVPLQVIVEKALSPVDDGAPGFRYIASSAAVAAIRVAADQTQM
eukprot:40735-Prymnesium_polylepis.1